MRIAKLKVMIPDCPHCGNPIVINGFSQTVICESCNTKVAIHSDQWRQIFYSVYQETGELLKESERHLKVQIDGTFEMHVTGAGITALPCDKCSSILEVQQVSAGSTILYCHSCGHHHSLGTIPKDSSAEESLYAICKSLEDDDSKRRQAAPISMNCPNCAAALKISRENERITECEFCNGEFLIPEPLWKRLHPVKIAVPWIVLYDKPPPPTAEELAEQKKKDAVAQETKAMQKEIDDLDSLLKSVRSDFGVIQLLGYIGSVVLGIFAVGFPISFIEALSNPVGSIFCKGTFSVSETYSGGSSNHRYYCTLDGVTESFNIFMLYALLIGILGLASIFTVYSIVPYFKMCSKVRQIRAQRDAEEELFYRRENSIQNKTEIRT